MIPTRAADHLGESTRKQASESDAARRVRALATMHSAFIWRTALRLGLAPDAADDALQQVLIVAARRIDDIAVGAEKSFLYRTTANVTAEMLRNRAKQAVRTSPESAVALDTMPDSAPSPDDLVSQKQARAMLDEALASLGPELREAFVLFELEGVPTAEIAEIVGIPEGTVASRLRRAREKFEIACKRLRARHKIGETP